MREKSPYTVPVTDASPRISRRGVFKDLLPVIAGALAGAALAKTQENPDMLPIKTDVDTLKDEAVDVRDRLLLLNQRLNKVGGLVIFDSQRIALLENKQK